MEDSVRNTEVFFLNQVAVTVDVQTHLRNGLIYRERINSIINHPLNERNSNNKRNERNGWKPNMCFKYGSEYLFITKFLKPNTSKNKLQCNTKNHKTCAYISTQIDKISENSIDKITS